MQMGVVVKWSVILVVMVTVLTVIMAVAGLHRNPVTGSLAFIVLATLFNLVVLFMALRKTASENAYGQQLLNAGLIGLVAGVLILLSSLTMLTVVFPNYLAEMSAGTEEFLRSAGVAEPQIEEQIRALEETTPFDQALAGLIGTFVTSLIGGAIIAAFQRRKG